MNLRLADHWKRPTVILIFGMTLLLPALPGSAAQPSSGSGGFGSGGVEDGGVLVEFEFGIDGDSLSIDGLRWPGSGGGQCNYSTTDETPPGQVVFTVSRSLITITVDGTSEQIVGEGGEPCDDELFNAELSIALSNGPLDVASSSFENEEGDLCGLLLKTRTGTASVYLETDDGVILDATGAEASGDYTSVSVLCPKAGTP